MTDIKVSRLRWAGHVNRMDENELARMMKSKPKGVRNRG